MSDFDENWIVFTEFVKIPEILFQVNSKSTEGIPLEAYYC